MTAVMSGHAPIGADVLSRAESIALADCERVIERGMKTFMEVGMALAAIQQNRLYRAQYDTFEEYCAERWGFTGRRGRQLIEAAAIGTIVPIDNEGQARELAKVPDAERAEVLAEARERTGGKPTAKAIAGCPRSNAPSTRYHLVTNPAVPGTPIRLMPPITKASVVNGMRRPMPRNAAIPPGARRHTSPWSPAPTMAALRLAAMR